MEKLIMLIDIYEEEVVWVHSVWEKITDKENARIISKKFWFIQRLVENEKIDKEKYYGHKYKPFFWNSNTGNFAGFWTEDGLIMLLSIQDEPLDFLASILK